MSSNDVEREPGPSRFRKPLILHILILLAITLMKNIITENMQHKQCSTPSTVDKPVIKDICAKTTRSMKNMKIQMKARSKHLPKLLLSRAGDIHPNPGPKEQNLCLNCKKKNSKSQSVTCNTCCGCSHLNCSASPGDQDISKLLNQSFEWLCPNPTCSPNHHTGLGENIQSTVNRFNTLEACQKIKKKPCTKRNKHKATNIYQIPKKVLKVFASSWFKKDGSTVFLIS